MLQYERIDISDGNDFDNSNNSVECMICHYWYDSCHDSSMIVQKLDDFVILRAKGVDYRCCVVNMSKKDAISLLNNSVLDSKGVL